MELGSQNEFKNIEFGEKHDFTKVKPMFLFFVMFLCAFFSPLKSQQAMRMDEKTLQKMQVRTKHEFQTKIVRCEKPPFQKGAQNVPETCFVAVRFR